MLQKLMNLPKKLMRDFQAMPKMQQVVILVVVALAAFWLWKNYGTRREGFSYPKTADKTLTCTMYFTEWCPACKAAKPEWAKLVEALNGRSMNGTKILVTSIDCEKYPDIAKKQNVTGYPTFKFDLDGHNLDFSGDRTFDNFKRFIDSVLMKN